MQNWNTFDSPETFSIIISKFPQPIRDRWIRKVLSLRKKVSKGTYIIRPILFYRGRVSSC